MSRTAPAQWPPCSAQRARAALQALLLLAGIAAIAWFQPAPLPLWAAAWLVCAGALWAYLGAHSTWLQTLMLQTAALGTASSIPGWGHIHWVVKPLPMVFAIIFVAASAYSLGAKAKKHSKSWWLLGAALVGSLAGDAFLLSADFFIHGLVSFLCAHVAYIVLFAQGVPWLGQRTTLAATLGIGAAMYGFLWQGGLPPDLRIPVAVYVTAIALMAAQALGRASTLADRAARQVALGACLFMLSDSILAINRFVLPLPLADVWVLCTYYAAQAFIVQGMVARLRAGAQA